VREQVGIKPVAAVTVVGTVTYDTWTTYFPTYAQTNAGVPAAEALTAGRIVLAFFAVLQPPAGMLSARVGRKPLLIVFASGCSRWASRSALPLLALVSSVFGVLLLVQCVGMVLRSGYTAIAAARGAELVPGRVRAAGSGSPTR
jgi:MHS family alpha-ketoglutarate permease-like MFS transporter